MESNFSKEKHLNVVYHSFEIRIVGTYLRVLLDDGWDRFYALYASPLTDKGLDALNLVLMAF